MKYKKLLVTGGSGFIGSNYIRKTLSDYPDVQIVNADCLSYASDPENTADFDNNSRYLFRKVDISDRKQTEKLFEAHSFDALIHFAAESSVDRSFLYPGLFEKTNVEGTKNLLECSLGKIGRFLYVSTDEVYGDREYGSFSEDDPLFPMNPYSLSKKKAEDEVKKYSGSLDFVITRSTNNFGIGQHPEKLIPLSVKALCEGKKIPVHGNGLQKRDWLYCIDNCNAINTVLEKGKSGEIYNIGAHNEKTNLEIIDMILGESGKTREWLLYTSDRPVSEKRYSVDTKKIEALGFEKSGSFEEEMINTIRFYLKKYQR